MSAVSVFPMCVRATRGLLRLRAEIKAGRSTAVSVLTRALSRDPSTGEQNSAADGLTQAILQDRLLQQQKSPVNG